MQAIRQVSKLNPILGLLFESQLFNRAGEYIDGYGGGSWTSRRIADGIWIAVPPMDGDVAFTNSANYYSGHVSALTAGAAITCIALNRILCHVYEKHGDTDITIAISNLWEQTTEACRNFVDPNFDVNAFNRIID